MAQSFILPPSELYQYSQQIIFSTQKISGPLKSSPNGEISPNLVTLRWQAFLALSQTLIDIVLDTNREPEKEIKYWHDFAT